MVNLRPSFTFMPQKCPLVVENKIQTWQKFSKKLKRLSVCGKMRVWVSLCEHTERKLQHVACPRRLIPLLLCLRDGRVSWRVLMVQVRSYRFYTFQVFKFKKKETIAAAYLRAFSFYSLFVWAAEGRRRPSRSINYSGEQREYAQDSQCIQTLSNHLVV